MLKILLNKMNEILISKLVQYVKFQFVRKLKEMSLLTQPKIEFLKITIVELLFQWL
jgi:hypothetical protein